MQAVSLQVAGLLLSAVASVASAGLWDKPITIGAWRLAAKPGLVRWLIVHNPPSGTDLMFHIEVLEEKVGDPSWTFSRPALHMAITEEALRRSILGPSRRRWPYPEQYEEAYASWRKAGASSHAPFCSTTVEACLK